MTRSPNRRMSDASVKDRLRRMKPTDQFIIRAKAVAKQGDTLKAIKLLKSGGHVTQAHVDAHAAWLAEQLA